MARPQFVVQHFLVCQDAPWQGAAGPRTLRTLEGVGYYRTVPPDAEYPEIDLWLYFRLLLTNNVSGRRTVWAEVLWLDAPEGERRIQTFPLSPVQLWSHSPVTSVAAPLNQLMIPGRGRYEFRLMCRKRFRLYGVQDQIAARDYICVE